MKIVALMANRTWTRSTINPIARPPMALKSDQTVRTVTAAVGSIPWSVKYGMRLKLIPAPPKKRADEVKRIR